jgi:hypothetical protein
MNYLTKVRAIVALTIFILVLSFSSNVNASIDTQEESLVVSPLPFWNTTSSESTSINYDSEKINVNSTDILHEDSISGFVETSVDDVPLSCDLGKYSDAGNGGDSGTHSDTHIDDSSYYADTSIGFIDFISVNVSGFLSSGYLNIHYIFRGYRTTGSTDDYSISLMALNSTVAPYDGILFKAWTNTIDTGWVDESNVYQYDNTVVNSTGGVIIVGFVVVQNGVAMGQNFRLNIDLLGVEWETQNTLYQNTFLNDDSWSVVSDVNEGGETFQVLSSDYAKFHAEGDSSDDADYAFSNEPSFVWNDRYVIEIRYFISTVTGDKIRLYFGGVDYDGTGGIDSPHIYFELQETTNWLTKRLTIGDITGSLGTLSTVEVILWRTQADLGIDVDTYIDYIKISPSNVTGWQYDGSTLVNGGMTYSGSISFDTDGDMMNITSSGAVQSVNIFYNRVDGTKIKAMGDYGYYPFIEMSINVLADGDSDNLVWLPRVYDKDSDYQNLESTYVNTSGVFRWNLESTSLDDFYYFKLYLQDSGDKVQIDYLKLYMIADWSYELASGTTIDDVIYTENNDLIFSQNGMTDETSDYQRISNDYETNVVSASWEFYNISCSGDVEDIQFREISTSNAFHSVGEYTDSIVSTTLESFILYYYGNLTLRVSQINFYSMGSFKVKIPIKQYKNHRFQMMIGYNDFESGIVNLSLDYNNINSGFNLLTDYNNSLVFMDSNEVNISGYEFIRYDINLKYATNEYRVYIKDANVSSIGTIWDYKGIIKSSNYFTISSNNFTGNFTIFYLSGDFEYRSDWKREIVNPDDEVYQTDYSAEIDYTTGYVASYLATRNLYMMGFQFWRSEWTHTFDIDTGTFTEFEVDLTATLEFYDTDGTIFYTIEAFAQKTHDSPHGHYRKHHIYVYNSTDDLIYQSYDTDITDTTHADSYIGKLAIWRTQENYLALKYKSNDFWSHPNTPENWTYWISEEPLQNYQCNMTYEYGINYFFGADMYYYLAFENNEYSYDSLSGVSEPHFSTTWWESVPIVNAIIATFVSVGNAIVGGISATIASVVSGTVALFQPLFDSIVSTLLVIVPDIWSYFQGILDDIFGGIASMASDIFSFFTDSLDLIIGGIDTLIDTFAQMVSDGLEIFVPILTSLFQPIFEAFADLLITFVNYAGGIFGIPALGTDIASAVSAFVEASASALGLIGSVITNAINAITFVSYYITKYLPMALSIIGLIAVMDISSALVSGDTARMDESIGRYTGIIDRLFGAIFRIVEMIVGFIGGIIP